MRVGDRIGDYEIVSILGAGGMGQVYKVRNVLSDRVEAMKVLLPNLESDTELADRFLREIKLQAALDHPNIARLHTAQAAGNQLIMVMEFVEGATIEKLLESGPIGVRDAVAYVMQVLDALAYAHERGVVHRDIKPANIMRTPAGAIKLMDFGIARMQQDRRLTKTGHTVGSLFYMSPEQIKGSQPDPRSDIYSLGITLYEMVTGRRPFHATSDFEIMAAHLQQMPVAPIQIVPGVPPMLSDIILTAIAKEPEQRFQSAQAFRAALQSMMTGSPADRTVQYPQPVGVGPTAVNTPSINYAPPTVPYAPPPPPPVAMAPAKSSNRGVYMALGSIATVAVLGAAVYFGPRFLRTGASAPANPATQQVTGTPPPATNPAPASPSPAAPAPAVVTPAQPQATPAADTKPQQQNPPPSASRPPARPAAQTQPAVTAPPVVAQQPPVANPNPAVTQQPPVPAAKPSPELAQLREDYNLLAIRVGGAKSGLRSLEQQMRRQGLDLRGDITEAESRVDYLMKEAQDSIRSGDAATARRNLQMAERSLETIEKFLGR